MKHGKLPSLRNGKSIRTLTLNPQVSVSDGDTVRLRHTPSLFSSGRFAGKLSENTISCRIAAVDTPETAKFGKPGQPLGEGAHMRRHAARVGEQHAAAEL